MKQFEELTVVEKAALTEEEVSYYCDVVCAEVGVQLLPPDKPVEPEKPTVEADIHLVSLSRWGWGKLVTAEQGARILEVIASEPVYDAEGSGDYKYPKEIKPGSYDYPELSSKALLSRERYLEFQKEIEAYTAASRQYNIDKIEYDKAVKERTETVGWIYEDIARASSIVNARERMRKSFDRYLKLANGDHNIAMNFLVKANDFMGEDEYADLIQELCPGYEISTEPEEK